MTGTNQPGPRVLGARYEVRRVLGAASMVSVFEAYDPVLSRMVALKQLQLGGMVEQAVRTRFFHEARTAAGLTHPGIARIYDVGDDPTGPFFVQELITGLPLTQRLPLPAQQALEVAAQLADTLGFIHGRGIVDCAVTPQHVILTSDHRPILLDFGIADRAASPVRAVVGASPYLAPERVRREPAGAATDVYALGVLLYELLSGRPPIAGAMPQETPQGHVNQGVPLLRQAVPGMPAHVDALLARMTHRDAAQRPSMAEVADALRTLLAAAWNATTIVSPPAAISPGRPRPVSHRRPAVRPPPPPPLAAAPATASTGRRRSARLPWALLMLTLLGIAAWLLLRPDESSLPPDRLDEAVRSPAPARAAATTSPAQTTSGPTVPPAGDPVAELGQLITDGSQEGGTVEESRELAKQYADVRVALADGDQPKAAEKLRDMRNRVQERVREGKLDTAFGEQLLTTLQRVATAYNLDVSR